MLSEIIHIMEYTLYIYLSVSVGYIVLFSAASHFFKQKKYPATTVRQRFIILVPAYKEDAVIHACVTSVLRQTYPAELYDLIVISDHMRPETNASLRKERIGLIELHEKESSKAKALRIAAETITDQPYDYVLILDADNLISPCYLQELNKAVSQGIKAIQTHRKAKNMNTDIALLDAAIEEMNNSIFRKGHIRLGFSSALTGSGMAFDFRWFVRNIIHTHSTGEDKELEELLLRQGIHIEYIDTLEALDEKVRQPDALRNQRRRWIATQLFLALKMGRNLPTALLNGNGDYLLKYLSHCQSAAYTTSPYYHYVTRKSSAMNLSQKNYTPKLCTFMDAFDLMTSLSATFPTYILRALSADYIKSSFLFYTQHSREIPFNELWDRMLRIRKNNYIHLPLSLKIKYALYGIRLILRAWLK